MQVIKINSSFKKELLNNEVIEVYQKLSAIGEVRFVGGFVRDFLDKGTISGDIDLATTALPVKVLEILKSINLKGIITSGMDFGSVGMAYKGINFDITTLRSDIGCDGRKAKVTYTTNFEKDSWRRDFTINALYMKMDGEITDFHNGIEDLRDHKVIFIGEASDRIKEDFLRIIRFFRFSAKYKDIVYDKATLQTMTQLREGIDILSNERITSELGRILKQPFCITALKHMKECGILGQIFKDNWFDEKRFERLLKNNVDIWLEDEVFRWTAFISCLNKEVLDFVLNRLSLTRITKRSISFLLSEDLLYIQRLSPKINEFLAISFPKYINPSLLRLNIDCGEQMESFINQLKPLPITGDDIKLLYPSIKGFDIGKILSKAKLEWIEKGQNLTKEELLLQLKIFI